MRSSSSKDEDRSTTRAFSEEPPAEILVSDGGERTPSTRILAVVEI
jgi:hypothetical protein